MILAINPILICVINIVYLVIVSLNLITALISWRINKILMLRNEILCLSLHYSYVRAIRSFCSGINEALVMGQPLQGISIISTPHYDKLPSLYRMIFSFKPAKMESWLSTVDIIELTGQMPEEMMKEKA